MRIVAVVLVAVTFAGAAQEDLSHKPIVIKEISPGGTVRAGEILDVLYRSAAIRDQCLLTPNERLDVALNGYRVPLDCALWNLWYKRAQEITNPDR